MFLIYPYWNINLDLLQNYRNIVEFLIYPYWNINVTKEDLTGTGCRVSNLSILEYK